MTADSNQAVEESENKDPYQLPLSLKALEGTKHVFQFHFDTGMTTRRPDFILDAVAVLEKKAIGIATNQH
ncbi:hypothetical protein CTI12_AA626390 [Artemisia annua]|uniref:Uncharacterized protein n=1 Tax=Artemisia annua TaxID=35608 RepID=A0A2U1K7V0_ARTAN|nr:hypothetical protein CTI12_AA626390 [Artemisia annua]